MYYYYNKTKCIEGNGIMDKELVVKVKRLRGELNISISELSDKSGVSRTTLSDIFNEKRKRMNRKTISKLNDWLLSEEKEWTHYSGLVKY